MTADEQHTIPITPQELQEIAGHIPGDLWGEQDFTPAEINWLHQAPATMRTLIDHIRWAESELDFYATYCGNLNTRIRNATGVLAVMRTHTPGDYGRTLDAVAHALKPREDAQTPGEQHIRAHVPVGRGTLVTERGGLQRTLLTRLTDGQVMCAICFAYVTRDVLHRDEGGVLTDVCEACSLLEADVYAREGWDPDDAQDVVKRVLADPKFLDYLRELGPGASHVVVALQGWVDKDHARDDDGYQALAEARDEEDVAFEAAMRARRRGSDDDE